MKASRLSSSLREGVRCAFSPRPTIHIPLIRQPAFDVPARKLTTTSRLQADSIAAKPIDFSKNDRKDAVVREKKDRDDKEDEIFYARLVPQSAAYFTAHPGFTDELLLLTHLMNKYSFLPTVKPADQPRVAWRSLSEYRNMVGETVKSSTYSKMLLVLQRLNLIHPALVPKEVKQATADFKRDIDPFQNKPAVHKLDRYGRGLGSGRRKSATARAWLVEGTGEIIVNGKSLAEAFARVHDRESVIWALKATNRIDKYNLWALSSGGGTTGQAESLTLAVGKALLVHEPGLKPILRKGKN